MVNHNHYRSAAQDLAAKGRNGDTMLVHMAPQEVAGLASLGKITKNPQTGLPEAFSLYDIIPIIAGLAGTALSGGNPIVGAAAAGVTKTAVAGAQGESFQNALEQGLLTGALSYGVGSLGGSLVGSGAGAAGDLAGSTFGSAAADATAEAIGQTAGDAIAAPTAEAAGDAVAATAAEAAPSALPASAGQLAGQTAGSDAGQLSQAGLKQAVSEIPGQTVYANPIGPPTIPTNPLTGDYWRALGNGINTPGAVTSALSDRTTTLPLLVGGYGTLAGYGVSPEMPKPEAPHPPPTNIVKPLTPYVAAPSSYTPGVDPEWNYFPRGMKAGGLVQMAGGGIASMGTGDRQADINLIMEAKSALQGNHPNGDSAIARLRARFGDNAVQALRASAGMAPGHEGPVKGPGGGLDDLVPANMNGNTPIDLANDEFVVPSDVVSMLGDGSSDQGARKLLEMNNRVRQAKTGTKRQARHINDRAVMPA